MRKLRLCHANDDVRAQRSAQAVHGRNLNLRINT